MACADIHVAMGKFQFCAETPNGSRITTHCLYPSFEPVEVLICGFGDGFRVSDFGGARREAWLHGVDDVQMSRILNSEAAKHQIQVSEGAIVASAPSAEWLFAAVTAVANASASSAKIAVEKLGAVTEDNLLNKIELTLSRSFSEKIIRRQHHFRGQSGKEHTFDFALRGGRENTILISAVAPHHFSISSRYVAFADTKISGYENVGRFAVYDRELDNDDAALLRQVADLVPLKALTDGSLQFMSNHGWPRVVV